MLELDKFTSDQLLAIRDLPPFLRERKSISENLLRREDLNPLIFQELHHGCPISEQVVSRRENVCITEDGVISVVETKLRLGCPQHEVRSYPFIRQRIK